MGKFRINHHVYINTRDDINVVVDNWLENGVNMYEVSNSNGIHTIVSEDDMEFVNPLDEIIEEEYEIVFEPNNQPLLEDLQISIPYKKNKKTLYLAIYDHDPGYIPHFHVYRKNIETRDPSRGVCICLSESKYFIHANHDEFRINRDEFDAMITWMAKVEKENSRLDILDLPDSDPRKHHKISNWKYLVYYWNNYHDIKVNSDRKATYKFNELEESWDLAKRKRR